MNTTTEQRAAAIAYLHRRNAADLIEILGLDNAPIRSATNKSLDVRRPCTGPDCDRLARTGCQTCSQACAARRRGTGGRS